MSYIDKQSTPQKIIPAYVVKVNTSAFHYKKASLLERTQQVYLPKYWKQLRMDQKTIGPSCEDRLSQLTTNQIDRIIDMEKIRSNLHDKKKKTKQTYLEFIPIHLNNHSNIYQANFLAKINRIAIKRNIRHQKSQGFDQYFGEKLTRAQTDKKNANTPYKYQKAYEIDKSDAKRQNTHQSEEDDQKSIASIKDQLQKFQQSLENSKSASQVYSKRERKRSGLSSCPMKRRWFYGMSKMYIDHTSTKIKINSTQVQRSRNVDIESQLNQMNHFYRRKVNNTDVKLMIQNNIKSQQPLQKYNMLRVIALQ